MRRFAVLINPTNKLIFKKVVDAIRSLKSKTEFFSIRESERAFFPSLEKGENVDCLLVFGGDGTVLHSCFYSLKFNIPILGINMGDMGFLTEITLDKLESSLAQIEQKRYSIQKRVMLNAQVKRDGKCAFAGDALNDIVIFRGQTEKMIGIDFFNNKRFVLSTKSDGILIATPTGSTGYSLSAGGPILSPTMEAVAVVPLHPHALTARPMIFSFDDVFQFNLLTSYENTVLQIDGENVLYIKNNDIIRIKKAKSRVCFVKLHNKTFFKVLRKKLHMGRRK